MRAERDLTEGEVAWGATMRGHTEDGVQRAHKDSYASVEPGPSLEREAREAIEAATLRPGATVSFGAGERETEDDF